MNSTFRLACVQLNAGAEIEPNLEAASILVKSAVVDGAQLISLPECVSLIEPDRAILQKKCEVENDSVALQFFKHLAAEYRVWLHVGSIAVLNDAGQISNCTFLLGPDGKTEARYNKIHMFDVDLGGAEVYRESDTYTPGSTATIADLPWGQLGLTICYDLRFPLLYNLLAQSGADLIAVPSAFTQKTGRAHWHVLLRARSIETGCWIFAAAQCGSHANGRKTYGHSLIVNPWGEIVADAGEEPGFIIADIDVSEVESARQSIPVLTNSRTLTTIPVKSRGGPG